MHCNSALSIRYGQVQLCESSDSLPSLFVNVYSEVNVSSTYKSPKKLFIETTLIILTVYICLTFSLIQTHYIVG